MESIQTPFRIGKIRSKYVIALIYSYFDYNKSQMRMWTQSKKSRDMIIHNHQYFKTNSVPPEELLVNLRFNLINGFTSFMKMFKSKDYEGIKKVYHADVQHKRTNLVDYTLINYSMRFEENELGEKQQADLFEFLEDLNTFLGIKIKQLCFPVSMIRGSKGSSFLEILYSYVNNETDIIFTYNYNLEYIFKKRFYLSNPQNPSINARLCLTGEDWLNDPDNREEFSNVSMRRNVELFDITVRDHKNAISSTRNLLYYLDALNVEKIKYLKIQPIVLDKQTKPEHIREKLKNVQFTNDEVLIILQVWDSLQIIGLLDILFSKLQNVRIRGLIDRLTEDLPHISEAIPLTQKSILENLHIEDDINQSGIQSLNAIIQRYGMKGVNVHLNELPADSGSTQSKVSHKDLERLSCSIKSKVKMEQVYQIIQQSTHLTKLNLQMREFDIRIFIKSLSKILTFISSPNLQDLSLSLENAKLNHCNDLTVLGFFNKLSRFPLLKNLDIQIILSEEDKKKDMEIINAICKLRRLLRLRINHDYAFDMKVLDAFQENLIDQAIQKLPNLKEIVFDSPYQRSNFGSLLPILRKRLVPITIEFAKARIKQSDFDELKKWCPQHKIKTPFKF